MARIAWAHGVNANQVFYWRMLYRKGRLGAATLLPVRVTSESLSLQAPSLLELHEHAQAHETARSSVTPATIQIRVLAGGAITAANTPATPTTQLDRRHPRFAPVHAAVQRESCQQKQRRI